MIKKNFSVYLSIAGMSPSWIVGKISEDIRNELVQRGIKCNYGPPNNYNGEDVCHHMGWAYAKPKDSAKLNSVFLTHIDDKLKELQLVNMKNNLIILQCLMKIEISYYNLDLIQVRHLD